MPRRQPGNAAVRARSAPDGRRARGKPNGSTRKRRGVAPGTKRGKYNTKAKRQKLQLEKEARERRARERRSRDAASAASAADQAQDDDGIEIPSFASKGVEYVMELRR